MRATGLCSRFLAGVLAVWFGLVMAAPAMFHACPQGMATMATMAGTGAGEHHASHGAHHSSHRDENAPADCHCLGTCAAAAAAVLPPVPTVPVAILTPAFTGALPPAILGASLPQAEHSQPFATAPPIRFA